MHNFKSLFIILFMLILVNAEKPRVIISSDIGGSDPDDIQSMVHFLVYSDLIDVEGLISSPPGGGRKSDITDVLDEYQKDYNNLNSYADYPTYSELLSVTKQGQTSAGAPNGSRNTEGSQHIISRANTSDSRPLWVLVWGSITDVAQAVYDDPGIKSKIRVYSIGSWNTTSGDQASRDYLYNNHSDMWWIENDYVFRGMYTGGDQSGDLNNTEFVSQHVNNHGNLGDYFYSKKTSIKMGDTPSFFYVLSPLVGDIGDWDDPTSESWGGKFKSTSHGSHYWTDIYNDITQDGASVNKWREDYLRHWQYRMDRCKEENPIQDDTPPSDPTGLNANPVDENSIELTWNASTDNESGISYYIIYRDGDSIATSETTNYTDNGLSESTSYAYTIKAVNGADMKSNFSNEDSATTDSDTTPPSISSVSANQTSVTVEFSEQVSTATAENTSNYSLSGSATISSASLSSNNKTVTLTANNLVCETDYTLTVNNIQDRASSPNTIATNATSDFSVLCNKILVDLEESEVACTFELDGWDNVIKDSYTCFTSDGPGGTHICAGSNGSYDYVGVIGSSDYSFQSGNIIRVTWYNNSSSPITFTSHVSFDDSDRRVSGGSGTWYEMSEVTVNANSSNTSDFEFDATSAGSYSVVNVNCNYNNSGTLICDKIELIAQSGVKNETAATVSAIQELNVYPNPFNPEIKIEIIQDKNMENEPELYIYSLNGKKIKNLNPVNINSAKYAYKWNAANMAAGIYIVKAKLKNKKMVTKKISLIK